MGKIKYFKTLQDQLYLFKSFTTPLLKKELCVTNAVLTSSILEEQNQK